MIDDQSVIVFQQLNSNLINDYFWLQMPGVLDCNYNFGVSESFDPISFNVSLCIGVQSQSKFLVPFKQES